MIIVFFYLFVVILIWSILRIPIFSFPKDNYRFYFSKLPLKKKW